MPPGEEAFDELVADYFNQIAIATLLCVRHFVCLEKRGESLCPIGEEVLCAQKTHEDAVIAINSRQGIRYRVSTGKTIFIFPVAFIELAPCA